MIFEHTICSSNLHGTRAIITIKSPIPYLKERTNIRKKPFLGDFRRMHGLQVLDLVYLLVPLRLSLSGPKAIEGFTPLSNLIIPSVYTTILSMRGAGLLVYGTSLYLVF